MDETRSTITLHEGEPALSIERPVLVVLEGVEEGRRYVLPEGPVVIGRGAEAEVRVEDPSVSRAHVRLVPEGNAWSVVDLGSRTGTLVEDRPVDRASLVPGQRLKLGRTVLRLERTTLLVLAPRPSEDRLGPLVGASESMRSLYGMIRQVAPMDLPVVVHGETGTGKELVARLLHDLGNRKDRPFGVVDCTLLSGDHLRDELFGHAKGAFTGADSARAGAFEAADGGTVFLDEIGELPLELQPTLLRVLQEGEVRPLGSDQPKRVSVRIVAASHRDLAARVREGLFRQDLFYRLSAVTLTVPPLRDRLEDLDLLAEALVPGRRFSESARAALLRHAWPGNVRELAQVLRVSAAMQPRDPIEAGDLSFVPAPGPTGSSVPAADPGNLTRSEFEAAEIRRALVQARHHRGRAAEILGIARSTLYERMRRYGIE